MSSRDRYGRSAERATLVVFSASGNSGNVVAAITAAHEREMLVVAFTGDDGGKVREHLAASDHLINVPPPRIMRVQERTASAFMRCVMSLTESCLEACDESASEYPLSTHRLGLAAAVVTAAVSLLFRLRPLVIGGAATVVMMAEDRRSSGVSLMTRTSRIVRCLKSSPTSTTRYTSISPATTGRCSSAARRPARPSKGR